MSERRWRVIGADGRELCRACERWQAVEMVAEYRRRGVTASIG